MKKLKLVVLSLAIGLIPIAVLYFRPAHLKPVVAPITEFTCVGIVAKHTFVQWFKNNSLQNDAVASCGSTPYYYGYPLAYRGLLANGGGSPLNIDVQYLNPAETQIYIVPLLLDWLLYSLVSYILLDISGALIRKYRGKTK